jgi:hypothetical protein
MAIGSLDLYPWVRETDVTMIEKELRRSQRNLLAFDAASSTD